MQNAMGMPFLIWYAAEPSLGERKREEGEDATTERAGRLRKRRETRKVCLSAASKLCEGCIMRALATGSDTQKSTTNLRSSSLIELS